MSGPTSHAALFSAGQTQMANKAGAERRLIALQLRIREKAQPPKNGSGYRLIALRETRRKTTQIDSFSSPYDLSWETKEEAESDDAFVAFGNKLVAEFGEAAPVVDPMQLASSCEEEEAAAGGDAPAAKKRRVTGRALDRSNAAKGAARAVATAALSPEARAFIEARSEQDKKDGTPLWEVFRLFKVKEARDTKFAAKHEQYQEYAAKLKQARRSVSKSVQVVDEDGIYLNSSALSRPMFARYIIQLVALHHYYTYLLEHQKPDDEFYAGETNAAKFAGECSLKSTSTVMDWKRDFESNNGAFSQSKWGRYIRAWIMDCKVKRDRARAWLKREVTRKPTSEDRRPVFIIADFLKYLNEVFLPSYDDVEDGDPGPAAAAADLADAGVEGAAKDKFRVQMSTALAWAHKLGLKYKTRTKSYYVDGHDRKDVLLYRAGYLPSSRRTKTPSPR